MLSKETTKYQYNRLMLDSTGV